MKINVFSYFIIYQQILHSFSSQLRTSYFLTNKIYKTFPKRFKGKITKLTLPFI